MLNSWPHETQLTLQPEANATLHTAFLDQQIRKRAYKLIEDKRSWARGALARSSSGSAIFPTSPEAARYCAVGAYVRAGFELTNSRLVGDRVAPLGIALVNDVLGHSMALRCMKWSIQKHA